MNPQPSLHLNFIKFFYYQIKTQGNFEKNKTPTYLQSFDKKKIN